MHLTQSVHREVQVRPDEIVTICGERHRTHRESADRIARLAGALVALGVDRGDRVGILAWNSDRYHEFLYACWWIGAIAHPINTRWSATEIRYALDDSATSVLFVDDDFVALAAATAALRAIVHCGDAETPEGTLGYEDLVAASEPIADRSVGDDASALLLYTGGTTGFPKGVLSTHRAVWTSAVGTQVVTRNFVAGGRSLIVNPMFHVASLVGWTGQATVGGGYVFVGRVDPGEILALVERHRVTTFPAVPTIVQMVTEHPRATGTDLSSVQMVTYGASPMPRAVLERARATFTSAGFNQGYGMTECGLVTVLTKEDHDAGGPRLRSAGRACAHAEVRVVDRAGAEVPRGAIGEIVTRGDHVMVGYWNRPELTAEAVRDGWLHTGDLGRMDDEGYLFLVDRIKDMIITGGENVYSIEVENALDAHPDVVRSAVVGVPDPEWGERVHAVVVTRPGATLTAAELREHTRALVAGYKTPRTVAFVDTMPLTPAGKLDKRRLRSAAVPEGGMLRDEAEAGRPTENLPTATGRRDGT